ncbi:MAG TPA: DNA polymerase III subunit alpha [Rectinemataceae bacterium]|nr:DNA polymerase III subunit alpha [Rectinemataceae bacterium]
MIAPLLVSSTYSFHYGVIPPADLAKRARELGYGAIALTDRNGVHGLPTFIEACDSAGLKPILGTELVYEGGRAVLIAENDRGFSRITRLLTERAAGAFDARAAILADLDGLAVITDDIALLETGQGRGGLYALASSVDKASWRRLKARGSPCMATGEVRFLVPEDRSLQRLLVAIGKKKTVSEVREEELASDSSLLPSPDTLLKIYADLPEALEENEALVERVVKTSLFGGFVFPAFGPAETNGGSTAMLRELVYEGARRRYGELTEPIRKRVEYELGVIDEKRFADYFLVVREIARKASRTCGRGSAAASIVSYCLGITDVDPIRHSLYFERFLNPGRKDPPDIDVDFAWDERDELLAKVIAQYGETRASRVANHVCFQSRSALREAAHAYGMPDGEIGAFERSTTIDAEKAMGDVDEIWKEIASLAHRIVGFPRHLGVHSGGVIIVPDELSSHVPLERTGTGIRVTAWDKEGVEDAGLVKIDLLGNRSLAVVRDALANLRENGTEIDETAWMPIDDPETVELIARGDTMGVFYVESPAMRLLQKKTKAGDFEHLVIHSSIIRPAANKYINEYVDRLRGKKYPPLHPLLVGLFDESYGIMCYQEDTCKAAVALADFTAAEADGIRKVLSKKDVKIRLETYRAKFFAGAKAKGVDEKTVADVWAMIESFSGYSFVKAHSASYAMLSFKSAYLRRHHPAEFMAAVMSNHGGFYSTLAYASESRRMGLNLLSPDINDSDFRCRGKGRTIRFGLEMIGSLNSATVKRIVEERRRGGSYVSIDDFARRVGPGRDDAEALVGSGAVDSVSSELSSAAKLMRLLSVQAVSERHSDKQGELFEADGPVVPLRKRKRESARKQLESDMRYLGTTLEVHPLELWPGLLVSKTRVLGKDIPALVGRRVELVGWPITAKSVLTSEDETMEFLSFEDETALYETTLFPEEYELYRHLLFEQRPLVIRGLVEDDRGAITVTISSIEKARATPSPNPSDP